MSTRRFEASSDARFLTQALGTVAAGSVIEYAELSESIGRFRPRNNGFYGRFDVESVAWS